VNEYFLLRRSVNPADEEQQFLSRVVRRVFCHKCSEERTSNSEMRGDSGRPSGQVQRLASESDITRTCHSMRPPQGQLAPVHSSVDNASEMSHVAGILPTRRWGSVAPVRGRVEFSSAIGPLFRYQIRGRIRVNNEHNLPSIGGASATDSATQEALR